MITVIFESRVDGKLVSKAWEQGLALLLSSSDIDKVQAIFMESKGSLGELPLKLGKKLQQLELYEVTSYCLESAVLDGEQGNAPRGTWQQGEQLADGNSLDWTWVEEVNAERIRELLEQGGMIFSV